MNPRRDIDPENYRLARGSHASPEEGMCIMELAAYLAGQPHSDRPPCVSPVIAAFLRTWNDDLDDLDRQQLRRWAKPVLGTAASSAVELRRSYMALDWLLRTHVPAWLDLARLQGRAAALRQPAPTLSSEHVRRARPALDAARVAAWDAAALDVAEDVAWDAAAAAWDAARVAAWSATAAAGAGPVLDAARAATWSAAAAAGARPALDAAGAATWARPALDAARVAARAAARAALRPTVEQLQASAHELLGRMIAITDEEQ